MLRLVKVCVLAAESVVFIRVVTLSAHLQSGGEMFRFLWHRVSITLSQRFKGHLVDQVGGVIAVTLPPIGQLASGLIDGQSCFYLADWWMVYFFARTHTRRICLQSGQGCIFSGLMWNGGYAHLCTSVCVLPNERMRVDNHRFYFGLISLTFISP